MTSTIPVLLFIVAACAGRVPFVIPKSFAALAIYLAVGSLILWPSSGAQWSGTIMIWQAITCFAIGHYLVRVSLADSRMPRIIIGAILTVVVIQVCVCLLQYIGMPIFTPDAGTSELMGSRVNGTFNHPTTLGKALFLLDIIALIMLPLTHAWTRFAVFLLVSMSILPLLLSGSRANLIGALTLFLVWALLLPLKGHALQKLFIAGGLGVAGALSVSVIAARFAEDPGGGARTLLNERTISLLPKVLPFGAGPNSFVEVFGKWDSLIASGWPVHNVPLHLLGELGWAGVFLLLLPFLVAIYTAAGNILRGRTGFSRNAAAVVVGSTPGLLLIGATGWGFLHEYTLPLLLLMLGCAWASVSLPRTQGPRDPDRLPALRPPLTASVS
jgi:hypothetical protein